MTIFFGFSRALEFFISFRCFIKRVKPRDAMKRNALVLHDRKSQNKVNINFTLRKKRVIVSAQSRSYLKSFASRISQSEISEIQ